MEARSEGALWQLFISVGGWPDTRPERLLMAAMQCPICEAHEWTGVRFQRTYAVCRMCGHQMTAHKEPPRF